jgi:hypothetical protein
MGPRRPVTTRLYLAQPDHELRPIIDAILGRDRPRTDGGDA